MRMAASRVLLAPAGASQTFSDPIVSFAAVRGTAGVGCEPGSRWEARLVGWWAQLGGGL
jgi:hypothetical protein